MSTTDDRGQSDGRRGYRLGPFRFVPELRQTSANDPWAHRKGEPRVFALLWAIYLMIGALLTIFSVRSLGAPSLEQYRYGCLAMVVISIVGVTVLWPATRLSQAPPARPLRATLLDLLVLLTPVQAVILPMVMLTSWPWETVLALDALVVSWALLAACVVVWGQSIGSGAVNTVLTIALIGVVGAAPALGLFSAAVWGTATPAWWGMLSPVTAVITTTTSPANQTPSMSGWTWALVWAPGVIAAFTLAAATLRGAPKGS